MTGARGKHGLETARLRELLPHVGLDQENLYSLPAVPDRLEETNLQAWSYTPEFTPLVQRLLQLRRGGGSFTVGICGSNGSAARSAVAAQLAVGFTQHGLGTVLVDADPLAPGLAGLVQDPHQEGLVDMVRFGRSCRALLRKPFPGAPSLLGMGSFPVQGALPFEGEAWRGIVHRIALHSELALYVAPVLVGDEANPLLSAVDQVVYVAGAASGEEIEREVERLRRSTARVAAVVLCGPTLQDAQALPATQPREQTPSRQVDEPLGTWADRGPELVPEAPTPSAGLGASTTQPPAPADFELPDENEAPLPAPREALVEPDEAAPEPATWRGVTEDFEGHRERDDAARPPEEVTALRQRLQLDESDFSYSDHGRYSRTPLYLFLLLVVSIGGFLGFAFYKSRLAAQRPAPGVEEQQAQTQAPSPARREPAATQGGQRPGPAAPVPIDDAAAARNVTPGQPARPPQQTEAQPAATGETQRTEARPSATGETQQTVTPPGAAGPTSTSPPSRQPQQTDVPPPAAPAAGAPEYVVHVASYRKLEQANQDIANLHKLGYEARQVRTDLGSKGIWYRVYVGSYPSKEAAEQAREAILKLPGYDGFAQVRRAPAP